MVYCQSDKEKLHPVSYELISKASEFHGMEVVALVLGNSEDAEVLFNYGADRVILVENVGSYNLEVYTDVICKIVKKESPEIFLLGATQLGRELAPRIAARLNTGLTADCTNLEVNDGLIYMTRPAFGGNLMATIICEKHRPQMVTVRPNVFEKRENKKLGKVEKVKIDYKESRIKIEEVIEKGLKETDITKAEIIVSGGRGVGSKEGFEKLKEFANLIGGVVAGSRVAVENGWIEKEKQVGQTGKTVRPKIYFAIGISGTIQHLAGIHENSFIIAINKDKNAPIIKMANLAIISDWGPVIDRLIKRKIEKEKASVLK
ncbi:Electron transfer flavoprotein, alpha subunit-like protein [Thermosipho melanesiensis BI429]|uniref:Electron transfer flavoprotein, alpha subunit-like protein n=2 Tax=Thermosipho melanesiensis TaxID=46541 RepID=A6LKR7_THEM4|nr:Electron transfer flavoprotein, alpha subunit-like protein [Thermosipho melanesiensis BI429]